jgi:ubiquinone biosynthesis protein
LNSLSLIRDAVRAKEVIQVLVRFGFSDLVKRTAVPDAWVDRISHKLDPEIATLNPWQRLSRALEELGPTFVKIGQLLASRPDLIPRELYEELLRFRTRVRPIPFEKIVAVIDASLGHSWQEAFSSITHDPIGSASIAQVHRATLLSDGSSVALKIQRPGLRRLFEADFEILEWMATEVHERIEDIRRYQLPKVVRVLRDSVHEELDFRNEAEHLKRFNRINPHKDKIFAPQLHETYASRTLLVMEAIEGESVDTVQLDPGKAREIATAGGHSVLHQIFEIGFFHADPHPGNLLITPDQRICLLDWGAVGRLSKQMRWEIADLLDAVINKDTESILHWAETMDNHEGELDKATLEMRMEELFQSNDQTLEAGNAGEVILSVLDALVSSGLSLPVDMTLLCKSIMALEQSTRALDPGFQVAPLAKPYLIRLKKERLDPGSWLRNWSRRGQTLSDKLFAIPSLLERTLERVNRDELRLNLHIDRMERVTKPVHQALNRIVIGLIISSLIIGSSMIITTGVGPQLFGYPQLGLFGYLLSALMGLWVIFDILRNHNRK